MENHYVQYTRKAHHPQSLIGERVGEQEPLQETRSRAQEQQAHNDQYPDKVREPVAPTAHATRDKCLMELVEQGIEGRDPSCNEGQRISRQFRPKPTIGV